MNKTVWSLDLKSLAVGFLLAVTLSIFFSSFWHSSAATGGAIAADNDGVYIMVDGSVRYIDKQKCRQGSGCHFSTQ